MTSPNDYTRYFNFDSLTILGVTGSKASGGKISTVGVGFTWEVGMSLSKGISIGKQMYGAAKGTSYYTAIPINANAKELYSIVEENV